MPLPRSLASSAASRPAISAARCARQTPRALVRTARPSITTVRHSSSVPHHASFPPRRSSHAVGTALFAAVAAAFLMFGTTAVHADAPPDLANPAVDAVQEPVTKKPVPKTLSLVYDGRPHVFHLLGLGVRQVTFLNISVYTVGFYLDSRSMDALRKRAATFAPFTSAPEKKLEDVVEPLIRGDAAEVSVRVVPVRDTDGPHLRNGFMRILTARMGHESATLSETDRQAILEAMDVFRAAFPTGQVKKGEEFVLTKTAGGALRLQHKGVEIAYVRNRWVAERLMEGYLREKKAIAPKLRKSVAAGLHALFTGHEDF
ncbi:hypothetical protein HDU87_007656 [Geranomyces variabilis]|uniref:Chalcone isomerase domain-containing protein n=1 Tax=Geranomyces variabilis TaxID=109894 RepID=A0AAD5XKA4_9FUNG|nr:hypothetical protein HDU87_007656 [Geranomyces variabilis]